MKLLGNAMTQSRGWIILGFAVWALGAAPVYAGHGALLTNARDGWINESVRILVSSRLARDPGRDPGDLTNLEVAQLTAEAAQGLPAGADTPAARSLSSLAEEFKAELRLMDVDVKKLEDRLRESEARLENLRSIQEPLRKKSGAKFSGVSRAYVNSFRGFGPDAVHGPQTYNSVLYADIRLQSALASSLLFDAQIRLARTIGLYYADPLERKATLRWLSLVSDHRVVDLAAGDFYRRYTPLTLWNSEIPVYTLTEPTPYLRARKSVEERVYLDHGPDWHMRGFEAVATSKLNRWILESARLQAMVGELKSASAYRFSDEYGAGQASLGLFNGRLEIQGTGLILQDNPRSSDAPYLPDLTSTYARKTQVGSLSSQTSFAVPYARKFSANVEWAGSRFQDDSRDADSLLQDWALRTEGSLEVGRWVLTARYLSNGPYFYSPGAQTNRYTPAVGAEGYLTTNQEWDDALPGYLDRFLFREETRPAFAPYDRLAENALPYGEASPNREGYSLGLSARLGKDEWIQPRVSVSPRVKEIEPNVVFTSSGDSVLPVDKAAPSDTTRTFQTLESVLILNLAKALKGTPSTCALSLDYKRQQTEVDPQWEPFVVQTFLVGVDAGPFPKAPVVGALVLSVAYENTRSTGREYTLNGLGTPPTLAQYCSYFDSAALGSFTDRSLNVTKTSWAFGFRYPLGANCRVVADLFLSRYAWEDIPGFDRREQIWRANYEVSF